MAKIKTQNGFRFVKELGGAIKHEQPSSAATWLTQNGKVLGHTLDYGCGHGFDADHFGWVGFDPYYRQSLPDGKFDTIICNHVLNMLTSDSRAAALKKIQALLHDDGTAWIIVPRNIPRSGKLGTRKRIQNYVILDLLSVFSDQNFEIYRLTAKDKINDRTNEIELSL